MPNKIYIKTLLLLIMATGAVECTSKKRVVPFVDGPVSIATPVVATPSPDKQVLSALFDNLSFEVRDAKVLTKNFNLQYVLGGVSPTVEIKNDLRYYLAKDTGTVVTIKINHLGKQFVIDESDQVKFNGVRTFSFKESIMCDSIGTQQYFIQVYMMNKWGGQISQVSLDSWDLAIKQPNVTGEKN